VKQIFILKRDIHNLDMESVAIDCENLTAKLSFFHKELQCFACNIKVYFYIQNDTNALVSSWSMKEHHPLIVTGECRNHLINIIENIFGNIIMYKYNNRQETSNI